MCKCFLENFHRILVYIRSDIYSANNVEIIKLLIYSINNNKSNIFLVESIMNISAKIYNQLLLNDGDKYVINEKEKYFVLKSLNICCIELENNNYDMAYDIVDMLHVFPSIIENTNKKMARNYYNVYVRPVIKKWKIDKFGMKIYK